MPILDLSKGNGAENGDRHENGDGPSEAIDK